MAARKQRVVLTENVDGEDSVDVVDGHIVRAIEAAHLEVQIMKNKIVALNYAMRPVSISYGNRIQGNVDELRASLYAQLNEAYRKLFMWGLVADSESIAKIRQMAVKQYLTDAHSIRHYLGFDDDDDYDEDLFRAEIDAEYLAEGA